MSADPARPNTASGPADAPVPTPPVPPARRATRLTAEHADLVRAALIIVFVLLALQLLWSARILALTAFLGVLFGLGAVPAVDALERRGFRRGIASPLIIFGVFALVIALAGWSAPTLLTQSQEIRARFPAAIEKVEHWMAASQPRLLDAIAGEAQPQRDSAVAPSAAPTDTASVGATMPTQGRLVDAFYRQAGKLKAVALGILTSTLAVVGGVILVLFLAVYVAAEPDVYRRGLLLLFSPPTRRRLAPVLDAIAVKLRRWLGTQAIAMLVIGTVTTIVLLIIGVRAALPLGILAGILEFIPNIGPTLSAIPAVVVAFVDSPQKALVVIIAYWGIQFLENNLLIPYLMKEQLDLPPALTMMTQVVMAYVFGLMGLFVATPLLAAIVVTVQKLHVVPDDVVDTPPTTVALEPGRGADA
ncbi:MAG: AI-2E family transporter [Gemmatimonadetes bacterium]|nr:AI-2E family transporter [Gemmatimonadota bacterium]